MAGKILPNSGGKDAGARFRVAGKAFATFIFWVVVTLMFPYPVLIPYWPEAATWAPAILYLLAFFNLLKALYHAAQAVRLAQGPRLGSQAAAKPSRSLRTGQPAAAGARDGTGKAAATQIKHVPTVQRMR